MATHKVTFNKLLGTNKTSSKISKIVINLIDILEKDKRKRIVIDFESPFITFGEEIFEQLKTISFNPLIVYKRSRLSKFCKTFLGLSESQLQ